MVTINCARLGHTCCGDEALLLARIDYLLELGKNSLDGGARRPALQQ
ncbi:anaerobic ribonucleoside-triphosphate reductase [Oxalobacteraceae bacterium GrIS 1.11]